ncbi:FAD dependent oxidoreductase superfamily protein [Kwoniella heveanensis BCC8398]|uniref:FAD dependent oxidoreductase superfamily protein n=1 Tax=Kwoniella heveanensis BCC8398 TaxID=1296120 RepID=A0A1B9GM10_9TREE|nr:FAD dependent oxidoreductase superfamily protein [Kwoniella heveanensis BCC8398]
MVLPIDNPVKSFWIEGADSHLRNHRSTPDLPDVVDVVIVGSGYTGATMAYWLDKFSAEGSTPSMVILEARDICGGATGRNGGQLRPHYYSRYPLWASRFGSDGALKVIKHEAAHLAAFKALLEAEGLAEEVSFKLGETFDAAMSEEAWARLKGAYEDMKKDIGEKGDIIKDCRLIEDPNEAERFTQMKGCIAAVVHPSGQVWPYKFVHALLQLLLKTGQVNLQANTPALSVSQQDADGLITVDTPRGKIKAKTVIHATNRWASHLLPEFGNLIYAGRGTLAAIKAPQGFLKNTGAQHWDSIINNYHLQLPPPHNTIIVGGAKPLTVHDPKQYVNNDREDEQFRGVPDFYAGWPKRDVVGWTGRDPAELERSVEEGGVWSGVYSTSIDSFPFVGPVPKNKGHFVAAGFAGHGMPRILGSTAHLAPLVLADLGVKSNTPSTATIFPPLPEPFQATEERIQRLQSVDALAKFQKEIDEGLVSSKKPFAGPAPQILLD